MAVNTGKKQRGRPFQPGQSGNPTGKPRGALNQTTRAALALLDGDLEAITQVCIDKAKEGDLGACRLILDKLIPNARELPITLKIPKVTAAADIPKALGAIVAAVAGGAITPGEGQGLAAILELYRRGLELGDLEARLTALEDRQKHGS